MAGLIAEDPALDSLVAAMENLLVLEVSREPLEAHHLSGLHELAATAYHRACYVIPVAGRHAAGRRSQDAGRPQRTLQAVRSLGDGPDSQQLRSDALLALAATSGGSATMRGGGVGLLHADGKLAEADLVAHLHGHLHSSREGGEDGPNFLRGLLKTARSALWLVPEVLVNIHEVLRDVGRRPLRQALAAAAAGAGRSHAPRDRPRGQVRGRHAGRREPECRHAARISGSERDAAGGGSQPPGPRRSGRRWMEVLCE